MQTDSNGRAYVEFSGGPGYQAASTSIFGFLTGDVNRPTDLATNPANQLIGTVSAPAGLSNDAFIINLITSTANYNTQPVNYSLIPSITGYNSNSYINSLIKSSGGTINANTNWQYVGFSKTIPSGTFVAKSP